MPTAGQPYWLLGSRNDNKFNYASNNGCATVYNISSAALENGSAYPRLIYDPELESFEDPTQGVLGDLMNCIYV